MRKINKKKRTVKKMISKYDKQKKQRIAKNRHQNMSELRQTKTQRVHEKIPKNRSNNMFKKLKDNSELKRVEVDALASFFKDEIESFSNAKFYFDYDNSEEDRFIEFR